MPGEGAMPLSAERACAFSARPGPTPSRRLRRNPRPSVPVHLENGQAARLRQAAAPPPSAKRTCAGTERHVALQSKAARGNTLVGGCAMVVDHVCKHGCRTYAQQCLVG